MKCEYSKRECFYTPVATAFSCYLCAVHDAYKQGTADANANRPHGEWIDTGEMEEYWAEEYECSVCGLLSHNHNFCPNCGASMRKEGDEK